MSNRPMNQDGGEAGKNAGAAGAAGGAGAGGGGGGTTASILAELRGASSGAEAAPVASRRPTGMSTQVVVFGLIVGVSAAALFLMRQMSMRAGVRMDTIEVTYTPDENAHRRAADQERIIEFLSQSSTPVQVPAEKISKNPFFLGSEGAVAPVDEDPAEAERSRLAELERQKSEARRQEIEDRLSRLVLHSVMGGSRPLARIGEATVRVGDTLDEMFLVVSIEGRTVTLEVDGERHELSLDEKRAPATGPRSGGPDGSGPSGPRRGG